jgi:hypothetical protein
MRNVSTMNDRWTASSFLQESTTELDASSSSSVRKFNHDGHLLDPGNLGRWNMHQEAIRCHSLPLSSSKEPSSTVLLETRSSMMHILELPPSSRPLPLAFKNNTPPLKPQRAMSISHLEEEEGITHYDSATPPWNPKRILSLLDCVEVRAESSQARSNQPPGDRTSDSSPSMPNRMVSLTGYDNISVARWCAHHPSLCSSPGYFVSDGATNSPRIPCRRGSIMMDSSTA